MDFVILSVNGRDVSNSSHEEAVRCFETAQEPITIQVLRKQSINRSNQHKIDTKIDNYEPNKSSLNFISTSVQTELAGLINEDYADNYYVFEDGDDYDEDNVEEEEEEEEYDEMTNIRDCKLREDVYFEEVTLRKCTSQEKLGLTVCYNYACEKDNNTDIPEVYISEILKDSLAGRDGRLREGDQILQVNGKDIESKEQTERVFSQIKNTVVILVSRCLYQTSLPNSPDNVPAYQNSMIELLLQLQKRQYEGTTTTTLDSIDKNDVGAFSTSTSSSPPPPPVPLHNNPSVSGLNNSLTSTSSSSQNSHTSNKDSNSSSIQFSTDKNPTNFNETLKESMKKIDDLSIGVKTKICGGRILKNTSDTEHIYETIPESDNEPIYSSPYESKTIVHEHRSKSSTKSNSSIEEKDNSSSAYNTGESCNSNPLVLELQKSTDIRELHGSTLVLCQSDNNTPTTMTPSIYFNPPPNCDIAANQIVRSIQASLSAPQFNNYQSTTIDKDDKKQAPINSCQHHCYHNHHPQYQYYQYYQPHHQPNKINNRNLNNWGELNNRDKDTHSIGSSVLYTNIDHSEQSAMLQQQIFTQALNRKNIIKDDCRDRDDKSRGKFRAPNLTQYHFIGSQQQVRQSNTMSMQEDKCDPHMEWKVKRRPDGTRYIVRRPVRNRLLGNRTLEISEERAGQTTEDDTVSEIKLGRYWTKEERKRHLEQARQRKQRHQAVLRQQFKQHENSLNINHADEETNSTTMRKSNCQDTTGVNQNSNRIDHNIHCGGNGKPSVGLLSVTTV